MVQDTYQPDPVFGKQGFRIEPEAGENLRAIDAVGTRRQVLEMVVTSDEPVDQVRLQLDYHILLNSGALIVVLLLTQVKGAAGAGNFHDQLGCAEEITFFVNVTLSAHLGRNAQIAVRLRFALLIELDCATVTAVDSRGLALVI